MRLEQHVYKIKNKILSSFQKELRRFGLESKRFDDSLADDNLRALVKNIQEETGNYSKAYKKILDEYTFTFFNRIAAIKVMEARLIIPEVITQRANYGDRSIAHKLWLEENPDKRNEQFEALQEFISYWFDKLSEEINLFSKDYLYHLLPDIYDLKEIINFFNEIEEEQWKSDDIMGWLYESYNKTELREFKESKDKIEYDKVSLTSQVYTPKWVVKFLVDNSLGKLYLEMYPDSELKDNYKIANAPKTRIREPKKPEEITLIDPAPGSGNFLLYAFDFFYNIYLDQDYNEDEIPQMIIENNLYGIDLDDRGIQIAQLGLFIKAKEKNRNVKIEKFNVVSSDFYLPEYENVKDIFEASEDLDQETRNLIKDVWNDLRFAYKFGSLLSIEEKFNRQFDRLIKLKDTLFGEVQMTQFSNFRNEFFPKLKEVIGKYSNGKERAFLRSKTIDSITFLEIITRKYDISVANPPYTDSSDYGEELKQFINDNYKGKYKFNSNLYSCFLKKCADLILEDGKTALVHPPTFMYIKTFEDSRKFILNEFHINIFVEWGYLGMFNPSARVDSAMYVLEKNNTDKESVFIKLNHLYEGKRYEALFKAYYEFLEGRQNELVYKLDQSKLKTIKSYPFIYWISDEFREKFTVSELEDVMSIRQGGATGNNERCLRLWWEVNLDTISKNNNDGKKWVIYQKGGPYCKWFGNNWIVIGYDSASYKWLKSHGNKLPSEKYYFKEGITFCRSGSKGTSFRFMKANQIISGAGPGIYLDKKFKNIFYTLAFLNSPLSFYLIDCLNPTVNNTEGDIKRIPFVFPESQIGDEISDRTQENIFIKQYLEKFSLIEMNYTYSPISYFKDSNLVSERIKSYLDLENYLNVHILLNEALINKNIFEIYNLDKKDIKVVTIKQGLSIGGLPVDKKAKLEFNISNEFAKEIQLKNKQNLINELPEKEFSKNEKNIIVNEFANLYQSNNDFEEFCIRHQTNPVNVWYWFKESTIIPKQRSQHIALELLVDLIKEILLEDDDGIVPSVSTPNVPTMIQLIEQKFQEKGFSSAQYSQFAALLGGDIKKYIDNKFFKEFSDYLNLFMYLPKTPFIWHLSSGPERGFECFIIIYKWTRDTVYKLRSYYIDRRETFLKNTLIDLSKDTRPEAIDKAALVTKQLEEIADFKKKVEDLLQSGYDPILDDGVGKNIAPLQKRKMLSYDVLNAGQLKKYLNADW